MTLPFNYKLKTFLTVPFIKNNSYDIIFPLFMYKTSISMITNIISMVALQKALKTVLFVEKTSSWPSWPPEMLMRPRKQAASYMTFKTEAVKQVF